MVDSVWQILWLRAAVHYCPREEISTGNAMSYATAIYAVDLDQIRQAAGSANRKVIKQVKKKTTIDAGDFDGIPIGQAIEELIRGQFTDADSGHMYGYALEGLCQHLGTRLDSDSVGDLLSLIHI